MKELFPTTQGAEFGSREFKVTRAGTPEGKPSPESDSWVGEFLDTKQPHVSRADQVPELDLNLLSAGSDLDSGTSLLFGDSDSDAEDQSSEMKLATSFVSKVVSLCENLYDQKKFLESNYPGKMEELNHLGLDQLTIEDAADKLSLPPPWPWSLRAKKQEGRVQVLFQPATSEMNPKLYVAEAPKEGGMVQVRTVFIEWTNEGVKIERGNRLWESGLQPSELSSFPGTRIEIVGGDANANYCNDEKHCSDKKNSNCDPNCCRYEQEVPLGQRVAIY